MPIKTQNAMKRQIKACNKIIYLVVIIAEKKRKNKHSICGNLCDIVLHAYQDTFNIYSNGE